MIPKQLQIPEIKFVLLKKTKKKPFQKEWQNKHIKFNDEELLKHINSKGNYGVMGGGSKHLIIIDFDDEKLQDEICKKLPKTFTVKTGSGKLHKYFFSDYDGSFKVFDKDMNTLADVQGEGKQVVGAGSIHPNGTEYKVVDDTPIKFLSYSEIKALLLPYDKKPKKETIKFEKPKLDIEDNFTNLLLDKISMKEVLSSFGIDTSKNPTECLFHHSKGGKCLGFNDKTAHCFHCDGSWNIFSFVKDAKKCDFKEVLEYLSNLSGLQHELEISKKKYLEQLEKQQESERIIKGWKKKIINYYGKTDLSNQLLEIQPLYYDEYKNWWMWDKVKSCWKIVDETQIMIIVSNLCDANTINSKEKNEILESLKQTSRLKKPIDINPTWIQFKDTIMDIETGERFKATPDYFVTNPIPYELHKDNLEETPIMDKIFTEWVGEDYIKTLYEILSYCLLPNYPIHRIFCFIGGGMNGKSKFLELLRKFIGKDNCCSTELDILINSRFEISRLHKKLVCQMGETNFEEMSKTSILKKLSGGDLIGFEYKRKDPFEEQNYAKILIATNNLPTTTDKTIGFYRRWLIIDFPNQFSEKKDILSEIPEEEYNSLALKCCILLKDLLKKRKFHNEGDIHDRIKNYESKSDFLQKFIDEFCESSVNSYISKNEFNKRFSEWCIENRHRIMAMNTLGKKMKEKGFEGARVHMQWMNNGKGGQMRVFDGIRWKN